MLFSYFHSLLSCLGLQDDAKCDQRSEVLVILDPSRLEDLEFPIIHPEEYLKDLVYLPNVTLQRVLAREPERIVSDQQKKTAQTRI